MSENGIKNKIKSIAAYIAAAVLLIVTNVLCRKLDAACFYGCAPFKPAEMTLNALIIAASSVFIFRRRGKGLLKKIMKRAGLVLIPLTLLIIAFHHLPDNIMTYEEVAVYIFESLLSAFAEDFVLCTLGCILLLHSGNMKTPGVVIMLLFTVSYGTAVRTEHWDPFLWIAVSAVIGYFIIQLHMSTESAVFCGIVHFLLYAALHFSALNSTQPEPVVGSAASIVLLAASLLSMLVIGIILNVKRVSKIKASV